MKRFHFAGPSLLKSARSSRWQGAVLLGALAMLLAAFALPAAVALADGPPAAGPKPIAVAEVKHDGPVNFEKEVLPILSKNCLACHSATKAENGLVLEAPAAILKGGDEGPAVVAGKGAESLLLKVAAHQVEPTMPPDDNNVSAKSLTPDELGLLKLWIDQGATGEVTQSSGPVKWQPLPPGINPIYAVAITPDGQFAACGRANQIFVYNLPTGRLVTRLSDPELLKTGLYQNLGVAHLDMVQSLACSPDGELLASGAYREIKLWRHPHDVRKFELAGGPAQSLATSVDGHWAATGDAQGAITVWDLTTGKPARTLAGHTGPVTAVRFVNAERLASASLDKSIRLWNLSDGAPAGRIDTPAPVLALAALPGGEQLASGGADNLVRVWAVPTRPTTDVALAGPITAVAASPDKKFVAVAGAGGTIDLVDVLTGKSAKSLPGRQVAVVGLSISGNAARLAAAEADGTVRVWDLAQAAPLHSLAGTPATAVAIAPAGNAVITGGLDGKLTQWKLDDPAAPPAGAEIAAGGPAKKIVRAAFRPGSTLLLVATEDGQLRGVETSNGQQTFLINHGAPIHDLALSADGKLAATAGEDKLAKVWNAENGQPAGKPQLAGFTAPVTSVCFTPDAARVIAGSSAPHEVLVFGVASGLVESAFAELPAAATALAAAGEKEAIVLSPAADGALKLWSPSTGVSVGNHNKAVSAVAASPADKNLLFSASEDGQIRKWNLQNNQQLWQTDHNGPVVALAVRPDNLQLATVGGNNQVRLWKVENGQPWQAPNNQAIPEIKGELRAQLLVGNLERHVALLTARLADDKKGATDGEARITSTAEGIKKSNEAKEAAAKTLAEKNEALKAPVAAKEAADKELEAATAAAKDTADKSTAAKAAADADAQNADLKKAADEAKRLADDSENKRKEAERKAKEAAAPAIKAQQEAAGADAGLMAAEQAILAAANASKKATEALPGLQAAVKATEALLAETQARFEASKQQSAALEKPFRAVAYSLDGGQLAAAGDSQVVRTFGSENGAPLDSFAGQGAAVVGLAYGPGGELVSIGGEKTGIVWDTQPAWTLERTIGNVDDPSILVDRILALSFSPDGKLLASGGGEPSRSGEVKLWNVADGKLARVISPAHSDTVFGLEFSPDGAHLASAAADRFVKVFDVAAGTPVRVFEGHTHHVLDVAWRADGKALVSGGADNVLKFWDFVTGDQLKTGQPSGKEVTSVTFVGLQNKVIASCGDRRVRLFNSDGNGERDFNGPTDFVYAAAITPDGKTVVAGGQDSTLFAWNFENGQAIRTFEAPKPPADKPPGK